MPPTVLLAATETSWLGTARMPRELAIAGWNVALLAPRGSLAERSAHVHQIGFLPDNATPAQWIHAFAATIKAVSPRLVMPCDDMTFRLLQWLALAPPPNLQPVLRLQFAALIADSLGDPNGYRASVDKKQVCEAADAVGVRVAPYAVVDSVEAAREFARSHGWPLVLKRSHSSGSVGVAVCNGPDEMDREFGRLAAGSTVDLGDADAGRVLVQAYVHGHTRYYAGTAWRGRMLCGYAVDKVAGDAGGPASVVRYFHDGAQQESAEKLAAAFGASGIFAPEYIVDAGTGEACLIEINRRVTPGTHRGAYFGMSSGAALLAAIEGRTPDVRKRLDEGETLTYVSFPHEWLRDPQSPYLRRHPVDAPWDDPDLLEAMLAMRNER